ncbi:MAG: hypothetical protein WCR12_09285 [Dysgonamonadaceae bacterium]
MAQRYCQVHASEASGSYTPSVGVVFINECVSKKDIEHIEREKIRSI